MRGTCPARSRRGSSAVFLCLVLSSLVMLSFAMIWAAREHTVSSRADAVLRLSGESLLSDFHREILDEYGLFLLEGNRPEMTRKLRHYASPSLLSLPGVTIAKVDARAGRFSVIDPEPIRQQITAYMKSGGARLLLDELGPALMGTGDSAGNGGGNGSGSGSSGAGYHNLCHGPTIISLPSRQLPEKDLLTALGSLDRLKDISSVFSEGSGKFLLCSYALGKFNTCRKAGHESHFFHNEVEYILCGKLTDRENERAVSRLLCSLHFPSNLAHIYADPAKRDALIAASEAIAPGPVGVAIQAALAGAWAWAESLNDAALLLEGYKVPAVKDGASWALDLNGVMKSLVKGALDPEKFERMLESEGAAADGASGDVTDPEKMLKKSRKKKSPVLPEENKGLTYEQHLRILLFFTDDEQAVLRMLDLIQINVRKDYDGDFVIGEQCTGIAFGMDINDRSMEYETTY